MSGATGVWADPIGLRLAARHLTMGAAEVRRLGQRAVLAAPAPVAGAVSELAAVLDGLGHQYESVARHLVDVATDLVAADGVDASVEARGGVRGWWNQAVDTVTEALVDATYGTVADTVDTAEQFGLVDGPGGGDPGGTYTTRPVRSFDGVPAALAAPDRGRRALHYLLAETGHDTQLHPSSAPTQIGPDEFELVAHEGGAYTVVLGGVTDLRHPGRGLDPNHRSVRDLDAVATGSAATTTIANNRYAAMVAEGLAVAGVPPGAELFLVGHSFGADTAVDLAADPTFNGATYRVTHVAAVAYHSEPQLAHVPAGTAVLVLQNRRDVVVAVEELGDRLRFDSPPSNQTPTGGGNRPVVAEFDGGWHGAGHHQDHYLDYVATTDEGPVLGFLASLDTAGFTTPGAAQAIDVSVPQPGPLGAVTDRARSG